MADQQTPDSTYTCYYCGQANAAEHVRCANCNAELILEQRYRLKSILGQGGFGVVYEADDMRLNRHCAIKRVASASQAEQKQIQNEVDILAQHASRLAFIPTIHDSWTAQQQTYIVMEFIEGRMLHQVEEPWTPERIEQFLRTMLHNLEQLHRLGIIHRDLKPQNIKYTPQSRSPYMLLDFGISKQEGATSIKALSPDYAPPEQLYNQSTDARSDLYSLGATAYHLLTGRSPVRERVQSNGQLPPPSQFVPAIGPGLELLLIRMLAQDPTKRPQDAAAALDILDNPPEEAYATAQVAWTAQTGQAAPTAAATSAGAPTAARTTTPDEVPDNTLPGSSAPTAIPPLSVTPPALASPTSPSLPTPTLPPGSTATATLQVVQSGGGLSKTQKVFMILGGLLLLMPGSCALMLALAMIPDIGTLTESGSEITMSTVLCIALPGLAMTGVGGALLLISWRRGKTLKLDYIENQILQVAHQHNYQVTATQVAMYTDLSLEQATQRLEQMARKGIISVDVSPQGHLVYNFRH